MIMQLADTCLQSNRWESIFQAFSSWHKFIEMFLSTQTFITIKLNVEKFHLIALLNKQIIWVMKTSFVLRLWLLTLNTSSYTRFPILTFIINTKWVCCFPLRVYGCGAKMIQTLCFFLLSFCLVVDDLLSASSVIQVFLVQKYFLFLCPNNFLLESSEKLSS